jgi:hypothetical protein
VHLGLLTAKFRRIQKQLLKVVTVPAAVTVSVRTVMAAAQEAHTEALGPTGTDSDSYPARHILVGGFFCIQYYYDEQKN